MSDQANSSRREFLRTTAAIGMAASAPCMFSRTAASGAEVAKPKLANGVSVPDSKLCREVTEFVREESTELLFHHSSRAYYFSAIAGAQRGLTFNSELLYVGSMFHDIGLLPDHRSDDKRFEVDGANAARDFLKSHGFSKTDIDTVWTAIALHTTPGIPEHMHPVIALVTTGVEMDVLGIGYDNFSDSDRREVVKAHPRGGQFKKDIIDAFNEGLKHRPDTTFGNVKADVLEYKDPQFRPHNFCSIILGSKWES